MKTNGANQETGFPPVIKQWHLIYLKILLSNKKVLHGYKPVQRECFLPSIDRLV